MEFKGTEDAIVDSIYNSVHCDFNWALVCRDIIDNDSFLSVQENTVPHYWKHAYFENSELNKLTCREFIDQQTHPIHENHERVSQSKFWRYDESFALKTA